MGIKLESLNASAKRLREFQALAEELLEKGYKPKELQLYMAERYLCKVSMTYKNGNIILNLHSISM